MPKQTSKTTQRRKKPLAEFTGDELADWYPEEAVRMEALEKDIADLKAVIAETFYVQATEILAHVTRRTRISTLEAVKWRDESDEVIEAVLAALRLNKPTPSDV